MKTFTDFYHFSLWIFFSHSLLRLNYNSIELRIETTNCKDNLNERESITIFWSCNDYSLQDCDDCRKIFCAWCSFDCIIRAVENILKG